MPDTAFEMTAEATAGNSAALWLLLTNDNKKTPPPILTLVSAKVIGSSSVKTIYLPPQVGHGTYGGLGTPASTTPYQVIWTYTPDGGQTVLTFDIRIVGERGISITPSKSGPQADQWTLSESPQIEPGAWLVRCYYS